MQMYKSTFLSNKKNDCKKIRLEVLITVMFEYTKREVRIFKETWLQSNSVITDTIIRIKNKKMLMCKIKVRYYNKHFCVVPIEFVQIKFDCKMNYKGPSCLPLNWIIDNRINLIL